MKFQLPNLDEDWLYKRSWVMGLLALGLMYKFIHRDSLINLVNQSLPPAEAGLLNGMLWGDKSGFSKEFLKTLSRSGLIHLVVVSGSNVILIAESVIGVVVGWWGRKRSTWGVLGLIWGYALLVGVEAPVLRAAILLTIAYGAVLVGRKFNLWRALLATLVIMSLVDIRFWSSVSFWLSYAAFLGVVTAPKKGVLVETLWINLWIWPVLAVVFGEVSVISPITNLLLMTMSAGVTVIGFLGSLAGLIIPGVGKAILWILIPWLSAFRAVAEWGGRWPVLEVSFNYWMAAGCYLILGALMIKGRRRWD